ncbi:MAG: hypothetical protein ACRDNL_00005, partial [Spirillospora sp.]
VMATATDPALAPDLAAIAHRAEPFDAWGWPVSIEGAAPPPTQGRGGPRALWPVLAAVTAVVVIVVGAYFVMSDSPDGGTNAQGTPGGPSSSVPDSSSPPESEEPSESPSPTESDTPTPTPTSATPTPTRTRRTPTPTPTRTRPRAGQLSVGGAQCGVLSSGESCTIGVRASGGTVRWSASAGAPLTGGGGGTLAAGQSSGATVSLSCAPDQSESGTATVTFSPGGQTRSVSWRCRDDGNGGGGGGG